MLPPPSVLERPAVGETCFGRYLRVLLQPILLPAVSETTTSGVLSTYVLHMQQPS